MKFFISVFCIMVAAALLFCSAAFAQQEDYKQEFVRVGISNNEGIAEETQAIAEHPNDAYAYVRRGTYAFRKKDYNQAIVDYNKVIELNPHIRLAYNMLSDIYRNYKGDIAKADEINKQVGSIIHDDAIKSNPYLCVGGECRRLLKPSLYPSYKKPESIIIENTGSTNYKGFQIVVDPLQAPYSNSPEVKQFLDDLDLFTPFSKLPHVGCVKSVSFGTRTFITYRGEKSPDAECFPQLLRDIGTIERIAGISKVHR